MNTPMVQIVLIVGFFYGFYCLVSRLLGRGKAYCAYCGLYGEHGEIQQHIWKCEKHPLARVLDKYIACCQKLEKAEGERDHWKANHDNQVELRRQVMDRPDLQERAKSIQKLKDDFERLRNTALLADDEICQILGKTMGFPWFKDDQKNFPGATEENGIVTPYCAEEMAELAANRIKALSEHMLAVTDERRFEEPVCFTLSPEGGWGAWEKKARELLGIQRKAAA